MKMTKASVVLQFSGDIEGAADVEYLMFYSSFDPTDMHKSQAQYVGQIRIEGSLQGKVGSFSLTDTGTFEDGIANSEISIIHGSGTGELSEIVGLGTYSADKNGCKWEMDISL